MTYRKFYLFSVAGIILASLYPIYMEFVVLESYLKNGFVVSDDYPNCVTPYTPICIALIICAALLPLVFKLFKRCVFPMISLLGTLLFIVFEFGFEQIKVIEGQVSLPLQYGLCCLTTQVLSAIGQTIYATNNPTFKVHFYIISIVIILAVLNVIYGFSKMLLEQNFSKKRPLIAQTISIILFISLCILSCSTTFYRNVFYRNGTIYISPLLAILMSIFGIVFGVTVGVYFGSIFYGGNKLLSKVIPSIASSFTTLVIHIGEVFLMGGAVFRFGRGFLFKPVGIIPFSMIDIFIILLSGVITYIIMNFLNGTRYKSQFS